MPRLAAVAASFYVYAIRQVVASTVQLDVTTICTITFAYSSIPIRKEEISSLVCLNYICHFFNTQKGTRLIEYSSTIYCCCHHHDDKMNSCCLQVFSFVLRHFKLRIERNKNFNFMKRNQWLIMHTLSMTCY